MFQKLKEQLKLYFIEPLKLFFFGSPAAEKLGQKKYWAILFSVLSIFIIGLVLARFFVNLATVDLPADDHSLIGQFKLQAQKFINFAGGNFSTATQQAEQRAASIRAEKIALEQKKIEEEEKFSRLTFFYTAPYLGSLALPEAWEKKYRIREENNLIDFFYAPSPQEEYPLFQIGILSREEWEKKRVAPEQFEVLSMVSNFVFFDKFFDEIIDNPVKQADYDGMKKQVKSILASFKSYKQE